jgi:hypothetical protein
MSKVSHPFDSWSTMPDRVLNNTGKPGVTVTAYRDSAAEEELVAAAKDGDEAAFETLFNRHQGRIFVLAFRYTRYRHNRPCDRKDPSYRHALRRIGC